MEPAASRAAKRRRTEAEAAGVREDVKVPALPPLETKWLEQCAEEYKEMQNIRRLYDEVLAQYEEQLQTLTDYRRSLAQLEEQYAEAHERFVNCERFYQEFKCTNIDAEGLDEIFGTNIRELPRDRIKSIGSPARCYDIMDLGRFLIEQVVQLEPPGRLTTWRFEPAHEPLAINPAKGLYVSGPRREPLTNAQVMGFLDEMLGRTSPASRDLLRSLLSVLAGNVPSPDERRVWPAALQQRFQDWKTAEQFATVQLGRLQQQAAQLLEEKKGVQQDIDRFTVSGAARFGALGRRLEDLLQDQQDVNADLANVNTQMERLVAPVRALRTAFLNGMYQQLLNRPDSSLPDSVLEYLFV